MIVRIPIFARGLEVHPSALTHPEQRKAAWELGREEHRNENPALSPPGPGFYLLGHAS